MIILIVMQLFSDRVMELEFLENHYRTEDPELIVLYGRRRVGKTELCLQFSKDKPHVYFLADRRPEPQSLQEMKREMSLFIGDESFNKLALNDWVELFTEFVKWNKRRRPLIIIDEFPMLVESNPAIPSTFQKIWDRSLKDTDVMLILLGSSIAVMETEVLNYKSPLYGRRTGQWRVEPLRLLDLRPFFPRYSLEALINVSGCVGGIPAYLLKLDQNRDFWENVRRRILTKGEFLYEEADFLLREELREPRNYSAILRAIAEGARSHGEIISKSNIDKSMVSRYTSILEDLGLTKREYPIGAKPKPRRGLYIISDNYLRFWFRYIFPNRSRLESGDIESTLDRIREDYPTYMGGVFEHAARELLAEMQRRGLLPFSFTEVGRWWHRDTEIDLIALDERKREAAFIEVKWSRIRERDSNRIIKSLQAKTPDFPWKRRRESYGIVAREIENKEDLRAEGYTALDLEDFSKL